jgi:hypothetical protein
MPKMVVLTDVFTWSRPATGFPKGEYCIAKRGETIEVTVAVAERGRTLGALGTHEELAAAQVATSGLEATGPVPDEQIRAMHVDEIAVFLQQNPGAAEHVAELEAQRGDKARKGVAEIVERVIAEREREIAERARQAELEAAAAAS